MKKFAVAELEHRASVPVSELSAYVAKMLVSERYHAHIGIIDLRGVPYHGGTTLSSGALPKWDDFEDARIFIKACSVSLTGQWQADSLHESYIMDLFANSGVKIAQAVPAFVFFFNTETRQEEVRLCEVAIKFSGGLTYYRDLRSTCQYGQTIDELIEFTEEFPDAKVGLLNMFVVDYITNQEDRHAKNFGVLQNGNFAPLYDNGQSLHYSEPDDRLGFIGDEIANVKFLSKDVLSVLLRYCNWFQAKSSVNLDTVLCNLDVIDVRYDMLMTEKRLQYNRAVVERRVKRCREIIG